MDNAKEETERGILKAAVYQQRAAERSDELKDKILLVPRCGRVRGGYVSIW
jgi:hypothetical protein